MVSMLMKPRRKILSDGIQHWDMMYFRARPLNQLLLPAMAVEWTSMTKTTMDGGEWFEISRPRKDAFPVWFWLDVLTSM